jgi:hypothetical protein
MMQDVHRKLNPEWQMQHSKRSKFGLKLRRILLKFYIWNITLYGETWELRKGDQKYQERITMV